MLSVLTPRDLCVSIVLLGQDASVEAVFKESWIFGGWLVPSLVGGLACVVG